MTAPGVMPPTPENEIHYMGRFGHVVSIEVNAENMKGLADAVREKAGTIADLRKRVEELEGALKIAKTLADRLPDKDFNEQSTTATELKTCLRDALAPGGEALCPTCGHGRGWLTAFPKRVRCQTCNAEAPGGEG